MGTGNNPLVSVVVRTKDRAELLRRALRSIASQTYRPIEAVVVNDGGCDLDVRELQDILGDVSLNYIKLEENRGRPHAGNVGIETAQGEYTGFLDDDDEIYPDHISILVSLLEKGDGKVAYTAVEMVNNEYDEERKILVEKGRIRIFDKAYSYEDLLIENYIPLMSLLFRSEFLREIKFDTSFELYEDWDMLLRAGRKNSFHFMNRITARYNQWGAFQIALRSSDETVEEATLRIYRRHLDQIPYRYIFRAQRDNTLKGMKIEGLEEQMRGLEKEITSMHAMISELQGEVRARDAAMSGLQEKVAERDERIGSLEKEADERNELVAEQGAEIREKEDYLRYIQSGHGWKMLSRYYRIRDRLLPAGTVRRKTARLILRLPEMISGGNIKKSLSYLRANGFRAFLSMLKHRFSSEMPVTANGKEYDNVYQLWIEKNMPDKRALERQKTVRFAYEPKISIIVPAFNTPKLFLVSMIESVLQQTYRNWELCISDGSGKDSEVREILNAYAEAFTNIRVKHLSENRGVAANSNEALSLATGEFAGFLDHDDELAPDALHEVVKKLNEYPDADFLYTDEVRVDTKGRVKSIIFRPDFSEYYYLSHPYIVHFNVFRKSLIDRIRGFNAEDFSENVSHDVDFVLRVIANTERRKIIHIPKPLYRWRIHDTSAGHVHKDRVHAYTKKAVLNYLDARQLRGRVEDGMFFNTFRVRPHMKEQKKVSIIIPTKNNRALLSRNLGSIEEKTDYQNYEVVIISNNTTDRDAMSFLESLRKAGKHKVIEYNREFNYPALNNFGVSHADGDYLLFLNDDIEVINSEWLTSMVELVQDPRVGVVGAKLLYPDERIQHAGVVLGLINGLGEHSHKFMNAYINKRREIHEPGYEGSLVCIREYSAVTGACMLTRRSVFDECVGMSEELRYGYNDIDFCLKVREKGYLVLFTPYALLYHHESVSRQTEGDAVMKHVDDLREFGEKWKKVLQEGDPYYNRNLSLKSYIPECRT